MQEMQWAAFLGGWICQYETETDEYIIWSNEKYDDGYNAYHRTAADGVVRPGFYRRIYTSALLNGVARSISRKTANVQCKCKPGAHIH